MADYTEHYQLHQWQPEDPFLRTDFNADLAKIDTALDGLAGDLAQKAAQSELDEVRALATQSRFTKLKEVSVEEDTLTVEINLSEVDWSKWDKVHLDCITNNNNGTSLYYNTTENGNYRFAIPGMWGLIHRPRLTFRVCFDPQRLVDAVWGTISHVDEISYSGLQKLIIFGDTMSPGAVFTLWGEA